MSNLTAIDPFLVTLNIIQQSISRCGYSIIFILGNIGSILNILVLSRRNYLRNSCTSYILASTLPNLLIINVVILTRILSTFGFDPTSTSTLFCKLRLYIGHSMTLLSRTYILLASIDRWTMTSRIVRRRAFAQIKVSMVVIPITGLMWCIASIHVLIYQNNIQGQCIASSTAYAIFFNVYNIVFVGIVIPILMITFSILTIKNAQGLRNRVNPRIQTINELNNRSNLVNKKNYDYQLLFMVLVQQCVYIITTFPFVTYSFYSVITINWIKSNTQIAIENLCSSIVYILVFTNFCVTFYIYILTSHKFRKDLKRLLFHNHSMNMFFTNRRNPRVRSLQQAALHMEVFVVSRRIRPAILS